MAETYIHKNQWGRKRQEGPKSEHDCRKNSIQTRLTPQIELNYLKKFELTEETHKIENSKSTESKISGNTRHQHQLRVKLVEICNLNITEEQIQQQAVKNSRKSIQTQQNSLPKFKLKNTQARSPPI